MSHAQRRITQHASLLGLILHCLDTVAIVAGLYAAAWYAGVTVEQHCLLAAAAALIVFNLASEVIGLYRSWHAAPMLHEFRCVALTWLATFPALLLAGFLTGQLAGIEAALTQRGAIAWLLVTPLVLVTLRGSWRLYQSWQRCRGRNLRGLAIVGANELGFQLVRNIQRAPWTGVKLEGFYDDRPAHRRVELPADVGACVGNIDQLVADAQQGKVHMIFITLPLRAERRVQAVLKALADTTASVYIVPDFFVFDLHHARWTNIGGLPAVSVSENPFYGVDGAIKRLLDVMVGSAMLAALALPMALIALAIKLTSRGPVLFKQTRYGLDGRPIAVWKFRSMGTADNGPVVVQATKNDPRVTQLGAILRRTSLDELPQLFNVLQGTMSLVGPRPHATAHNELYRKQIDGYMLRHKVKPGITGLAQVNGWRGETDTFEKMQKRVECDHEYIRNWSPWLDLKILARTVLTVLGRQNAY
ncbi:MAG: undecaprenyl-phosphate glucose phosphotransferase [Planctomycetes bacterium]|nr:undecaprenyl-phosphate glucose phosphotransferase [Planctomycetota bacterium]